MNNEVKPSALEVRRDPDQPPKTTNAIRLPEEAPQPPELVASEFEPKPTVEQISKNELRLMEEAKREPPVPDQLLEATPMVKPSLVVPVQANARMLQDFLDSLQPLARGGSVPIMQNARMSYTAGELLLEATDGRNWAIAKLKVSGGQDGFECVLPLQRARNVLRRITGRYASVSIGVDQENIHVGNYSLPHGGMIREFPQRPPLLAEELKVLLPSCYLASLLDRLGPVVDPQHFQERLRGIHLDFSDGVAVATDGHRMHLLALAELKVATRTPNRTQPSVTLTLEAFNFLRAVVDNEWVGLSVNPHLVAAAGADFGLMTRPIEDSYVSWRKVLPHYEGCWVVEKEALLQILRDTLAIGANRLFIAVDSIGEKLMLRARRDDDSTGYQTAITARRRGGPAAVRVILDPSYLRDAVEAVSGGLIRLGFDSEGSDLAAVTVRGADDELIAVIMPLKP